MISGRQALGSIDLALNKAHSEIAELEDSISGLSEELIDRQRSQADDYRELARIRVERLEDPELIEHIDHAERQVIKLLADRKKAIERLELEISDARRLREKQEAERMQQAAQLDDAVGVVDEAEARTQARLDADPDYRVQRDLAEQAERKALHGLEKADRSEQELLEKGAAYRDDPLFVYLWERKYGLPGYQAGGLTRWLDGKVARLVGFADARANYARLNEIPLRLREHAEHLRALADAEFEKLRELDESARAADGIPALEEKVTEKQAVLDQIDETILAAEQQDQALMMKKAQFAGGEDEYTQRAVAFMVNEYQHGELFELRQDAFDTPYPEDDLIVSRMVQLEDHRQQLESSIAGLRSSLERQQQRLLELESLRAEFKRSRYDRAGSMFENDSMIGVLLGQFLAGMLDRGMLWKVLKEQQRYRPRRSDPGFGSGGLGRGTVWKGGVGDIIGGLGRGGRFGGRGGGPGGRGGGGFRTGGGF